MAESSDMCCVEPDPFPELFVEPGLSFMTLASALFEGLLLSLMPSGLGVCDRRLADRGRPVDVRASPFRVSPDICMPQLRSIPQEPFSWGGLAFIAGFRAVEH
eukprot:1159837-Pelagomonas_calceolata.AAC.4